MAVNDLITPSVRSLCEVRGVSIVYETPTPAVAVRSVSFSVGRGEILGIAGESGSGKSTVVKAITRLLPANAKVSSGHIELLGQNVFDLSDEALRQLRWKHVALVPQNSINALNPVLRVGHQIVDALMAHEKVTKREAWTETERLMELVELSRTNAYRFPHELSGGMRQRVIIAMAMALHPDLLILDEPTTALDLVVQAQVLRMLKTVRAEFGFSILMITHDLPLLLSYCDRILVMYGGEIVEYGPSQQMFRAPLHPYTKALIQSAPSIYNRDDFRSIPGDAINPLDPPLGCSFHPRCSVVYEPCSRLKPSLLAVTSSQGAACHLLNNRGESAKGGQS